MGIIAKWVGGSLVMAGQTAAAVGSFKQSMLQASIVRENAKFKGVARKEMGYRALRNLETNRMAFQQQVGERDATMGGSGIDVSDSTALEVRQDAEKVFNKNRDDAIREHSFEARKGVLEENHMFKQADMREKSAKITLAANILIAAGNMAVGTGGGMVDGAEGKGW